MILLLCPTCESIFSLAEEHKSCDCGQTWGHYVVGDSAVTSEHAIPLGIVEESLIEALENRPKERPGKQRVSGPTFVSWVFPKDHPRICREETKIARA